MSSQWKCKFQRFCILFFRFNQIVVEKKQLRILHEIRIFSRINWKRFRSIFIRFEVESVDEERYKSKVCSLLAFSRTIYVRFVYLLSEQLSLLLLSEFSFVFQAISQPQTLFSPFFIEKTVHNSCVLQPCLLNKVSFVVFLTHCLLILFFHEKMFADDFLTHQDQATTIIRNNNKSWRLLH